MECWCDGGDARREGCAAASKRRESPRTWRWKERRRSEGGVRAAVATEWRRRPRQKFLMMSPTPESLHLFHYLREARCYNDVDKNTPKRGPFTVTLGAS